MLPVKTRRQISDAGAHDRWFILSLLFLNYFVIYAHRYIINYIQDPLRKELDLSETQLNMAAASFTFTYAFAQLFVAYLGDRFPRRTVLLASLTLSTIAFFAMGFSQGFYDLLTCRIVLAVTQAACVPSIAGIMADCFTEQNRSRAVAVYLLSSPVGLVFCASAGGWIADTWGWRTAFLCFGTLGFVVIGILAKLLREPERTERTVAGLGVQGGTYLQSLRSVLTVPSFLLLAMAYVLAANVGQQMGFFLPDHFKQHYGMSLKDAGVQSTLSQQTGVVLGVLVGGVIGDWLARRYLAGRFFVQIAGLSLVAPAVFAISLAESMLAIQVALFLQGLGMWLYLSNLWTTTYEVVDPAARSTAIGMLNVASGVLGSWAYPFVGNLRDNRIITDFRDVFFVYGFLIVISVVLIVLLTTATLHHDLRGKLDPSHAKNPS